MSKQVIIFPRGQLTDKDRRAIARAGCVVVEADDPSKVVTSLPVAPLLNGNEMLQAAMEALSAERYDSAGSKRFVDNLVKAAKAKHHVAE